MQLYIDDISKSFGSELIFSGVSARIAERDHIGLVGINGAGKTTLLNIIAGISEPDSGSISRSGDMAIGYQKQNSGLIKGSTIMEEMRSVFADVYEIEAQMRAAAEDMAKHPTDPETADRYRRLEDQFLARDGYNVQVRINTVLMGMGFAAHGFDKVIDKLSGGEQTRLSIARLLLEQPNLLILDEPTNHLDFQTLSWLEDYLSGYRGALLVVSHDRYFLDKICDHIWEMEYGELTPYSGNYSKYIQLRGEQDARARKTYEAQQEEIAKMEDYVARNLVRATTTKMAQSRRKALERMEPVRKPRARLKPPHISLSYETEPVSDILRVENLELAVGEGDARRVLARDIGFEIKRGDKVAIIGGNGAGKTTLLKYITGQYPPCGAGIRWGRGVKSSFYDQGSDHLDGTLTVLDTMWSRYPAGYETPLRSMLGAMGLTGDDAFKLVSQLSGGEKARLKLAMICLAGSNVLILDEPTNHLDLATKEVLENALSEFAGTIIMVSHDRYMLDRIPTRIFELDRGEFAQYKGRYSDYLTAKAAQPKIKEPEQEKKDQSLQAQSYNRGKEQRRQEAKRRKDFSDTEALIAQLEAELEKIGDELANPETATDYQQLQELCETQGKKQRQLSEAMNLWVELSD